MQVKPGDRLVVEGHTDSEPRREAEVLEVRGPDGGPPFLVRWKDGHEGLVFPGADAHIVARDGAGRTVPRAPGSMRAVVPGQPQNGGMKPEGWALIVVGTLAAGLISIAFLGALGRLAPGQAGAMTLSLLALALSGFIALLFSPEARERRARRRGAPGASAPATDTVRQETREQPLIPMAES